jgi:hypothetical protein
MVTILAIAICFSHCRKVGYLVDLQSLSVTHGSTVFQKM